jgi:hypothetical protein
MEKHLRHDPTKESRSRIKRLQGVRNPDYRLRVGDYRVFYAVDEDCRRVDVLRVMHKDQTASYLRGVETMKVAPMGEVRNNFAKYLQLSEEEPVFVTRNGKITAVIEYIEDRDIEDYLLERSLRFRKMLNKVKREPESISLAEYRKSRGV